MKTRLDKLLVDRGLAPTRERAQALILAGRVLVAEQKIEKPGHAVADDAPIRLLGGDLRYVSRGGLKLEAALAHWKIALDGCFCLDIGASTGGFTDCMLQHGAARVLAIDTGYGQIAQSLRDDPRVTLMERTNARLLEPRSLPPGIAFLAMDVSFISATLVLPAVLDALSRRAKQHPPAQLPDRQDVMSGTASCQGTTLLEPNAQENEPGFIPGVLKGHGFSRAEKAAEEIEALAPEALKGHGFSRAEKVAEEIRALAPESLKGHGFSRAEKVAEEMGALAPEGKSPLEAVILIKPQFEAGREHIGKGGIVRDPAAHQIAIDRVRACVAQLGGAEIDIIPSPITGTEGNREFLLHARWH